MFSCKSLFTVIESPWLLGSERRAGNGQSSNCAPKTTAHARTASRPQAPLHTPEGHLPRYLVPTTRHIHGPIPFCVFANPLHFFQTFSNPSYFSTHVSKLTPEGCTLYSHAIISHNQNINPILFFLLV